MRAASIDVNQIASLLVSTEARGILLLMALSLLTLALRRSAAATRHWLWFVGMVGLLALPVMSVLLPRWTVELPAWMSEKIAAPEQPAPGAWRVEEAAPAAVRGASPIHSQDRAAAPAQPPFEHDVSAMQVAEAGAAPQRTAALSAPLALLGVWGLGASLLLASLAASLVAVARLARRSEVFPRGRVTVLTDQMRQELGIRTPVRVLRGEPGAMPMSWGVLRPVILLPEGADRWHNGRLVSVLLHELSHVRRRDCFSQIAAELALALHWPNPLAWLAAHRLRVEREHACDDAVVAAGARPSEYALELLSLARGFTPARGSSMAAVAMARPVHLAGRVRALLEERRARRRLSTARAYGLAAVAATMAAAASAFTPFAGPLEASDRLAPAAPASFSPATDFAPSIIGVEVSRSFAPPAELPDASILGVADFSLTPEHIVPPEPQRPLIIPAAFTKLISSRPPPQAASCGMATTGWRQSSVNSDDDTHRLRWSRPGCDVDVRLEGEVEFTADFRDIARLGPGAFLRIEEDDGRAERRLDVTPGNGGAPTYAYTVDSREQPFDVAARAWYEGMLLQVFRRAGFMAEERVAAMLRAGGVAAVLQELDALPSDYVFATYVRELFEQADVTAAQAVDLLNRAGPRVESDYYLSEILQAVATRHLGSDAVLDAFIASSRTIESDHYRSEVLTRALQRESLAPARVAAVLRSATEISSDHYLSQLLESMASRYALEPELRQVYLAAVESIESDHYRTEVLSALLARNDLEAAELAVVLRATSGVDSDHYRTEILQRVATRALPSDPIRLAYLEAAAGIGSDHYRREALGYLVARETLSPAQLQEVIRAAAGIDSDHYKSDLLIDILRRHRVEGPTREVFMQAMDSIGSSHYRGEVAQALLRSDRGGA
jgi:beta-lactamase regulating signal transducer with metallopeptidase domain